MVLKHDLKFQKIMRPLHLFRGPRTWPLHLENVHFRLSKWYVVVYLKVCRMKPMGLSFLVTLTYTLTLIGMSFESKKNAQRA